MKLAVVVRGISIAVAVLLLAYIVVSNTLPFGATKTLFFKQGIDSFGPDSRIIMNGGRARQSGDIAYFKTKLPFRFDKANVRFKLKNDPATLTPISLGYKDQKAWHYQQSGVSAPFIDSLGWSRAGAGPYLYQKVAEYSTLQDFLTKPTSSKLIGVFDYEKGAFQSNINLPDYQPAKTATEISTPLRGSVTMFVYLKNEPFQMSLTKRDLNWYGDPDVLTAKVYKGDEQVFKATIDDDGDTTTGKRVGPEQTIEMKNPGPDLPEPGVYKLVIDAPTDTVLTKISTNLHKIAFEGPLYLAGNKEVYGDLVKETTPASVFTNSSKLSVETFHGQVQTVTAGGAKAVIAKPQVKVPLVIPLSPSTFIAPKADVVVNGVGYFAMNQEQYFEPTPFKVAQVRSVADMANVDFLLTNYNIPQKLDDGWVQVEKDFDLRDAVIERGQLSWVIAAPGLSASKQMFELKDIEIKLDKKGWFN